MKPLKSEPNQFTMCDCYSHALFTEYDEEDNEFYISLFNRSYNGNEFSFLQRLRWCWYILTKGKPYTDMVVIDTIKAEELATFLKEHTKSPKSIAK